MGQSIIKNEFILDMKHISPLKREIILLHIQTKEFVHQEYSRQEVSSEILQKWVLIELKRKAVTGTIYIDSGYVARKMMRHLEGNGYRVIRTGSSLDKIRLIERAWKEVNIKTKK